MIRVLQNMFQSMCTMSDSNVFEQELNCQVSPLTTDEREVCSDGDARIKNIFRGCLEGFVRNRVHIIPFGRQRRPVENRQPELRRKVLVRHYNIMTVTVSMLHMLQGAKTLKSILEGLVMGPAGPLLYNYRSLLKRIPHHVAVLCNQASISRLHASCISSFSLLQRSEGL